MTHCTLACLTSFPLLDVAEIDPHTSGSGSFPQNFLKARVTAYLVSKLYFVSVSPHQSVAPCSQNVSVRPTQKRHCTREEVNTGGTVKGRRRGSTGLAGRGGH